MSLVETLSRPSPRLFFALAAGLGATALAVLSGSNPIIALALCGGVGALLTYSGARLGIVIIFGAACVPAFVSGRGGPAFLSTPWVAALAWTLAASFRGVLVNPGITPPKTFSWRRFLVHAGMMKRRGTLAIPRRYRPGEEGAEGPGSWGWELVASTAVVTLTHMLMMIGGSWIAASSVGGVDFDYNRKAAVVILGGLVAVWCLVAVIGAILQARRATPLEAKMTLLTALHRELRSELIFMARFRARKRW